MGTPYSTTFNWRWGAAATTMTTAADLRQKSHSQLGRGVHGREHLDQVTKGAWRGGHTKCLAGSVFSSLGSVAIELVSENVSSISRDFGGSLLWGCICVLCPLHPPQGGAKKGVCVQEPELIDRYGAHTGLSSARRQRAPQGSPNTEAPGKGRPEGRGPVGSRSPAAPISPVLSGV